MNRSTIEAYNKFADVYDQEVEEFWERFPASTLDAFVRNLKGKKILNLGSGSGRDALLLRNKGLDVYCVDASKAMVAMTKKLGFESREKDFLKLDFAPYSFDAVWAYTSLLHSTILQTEKMIAKIYKWLKKDGVFLIGMIEGEFEGMKKRASMPGTERYFRYYTERELDDLITPAGFEKIFQERYIPHNTTYIHQLYKK